MNTITRHRRTAVAAVASLALLAGASSASAELPSLGAQLNAGSLAMDIDSTTLKGQAENVVAGRVAEVQRQLRSTNRKLRRAETRLRQIQSESSGHVSRLERRVASRVRSLRRSVRRLSRRVVRYAIAEARSATNGSWLVVSRTGRILEQSGGISVNHAGRGQYRVSWDMSRADCFQLYGGAPIGALGSRMHIDPIGVGAMVVHVAAATGPEDLGFYLAAVC